MYQCLSIMAVEVKKSIGKSEGGKMVVVVRTNAS
jgi:hypothetical protein